METGAKKGATRSRGVSLGAVQIGQGKRQIARGPTHRGNVVTKEEAQLGLDKRTSQCSTPEGYQDGALIRRGDYRTGVPVDGGSNRASTHCES